MRTEKRFTPALLDRFTKNGRGTGTFQDYIPWHRVGRGDPASLGRSHLMMWQNRQRELLSDGEWEGVLFSTMLEDVVDIREQHMLSLEDCIHELSNYDIRHTGRFSTGTRSIAKRLGIKHPRVHGGGRSEDWVMTTDQVLVLRPPSGKIEFLAVSYKPDSSELTKRKWQLLAIEKAYWEARDVLWILITPELFEKSVGLTLRRNAPWGLGSKVSSSAIEAAVEVVNLTLGHTFTFVVDSLAKCLGDKDMAQRAFWQAVWTGAVPLDLRTGWRPHLPIQILSTEAFMALNPVASRRSSWI